MRQKFFWRVSTGQEGHFKMLLGENNLYCWCWSTLAAKGALSAHLSVETCTAALQILKCGFLSVELNGTLSELEICD